MSESTNATARERLEALIGRMDHGGRTTGGPPWPTMGCGSYGETGTPSPSDSPGTFSEDGKTIVVRWEIEEDGKPWKTDFDLTYTKGRMRRASAFPRRWTRAEVVNGEGGIRTHEAAFTAHTISSRAP